MILYSKFKGSKLNAEELDANFQELNERVRGLEENPPLAESISKIIQDGNELHFITNLGRTLATVYLPSHLPQFLGEWSTKQDYNNYEIVSFQSNIYICRQSHTAQEWNSKMWQLLIDSRKLKEKETPDAK